MFHERKFMHIIIGIMLQQVNPPPALQVVEVTVSEELGKRIEEVREKVKKANENVTEDKKLGNRTDFALDYLYSFRDMGQLIQAVQDLGKLFSYNRDRCISELQISPLTVTPSTVTPRLE